MEISVGVEINFDPGLNLGVFTMDRALRGLTIGVLPLRSLNYLDPMYVRTDDSPHTKPLPLTQLRAL